MYKLKNTKERTLGTRLEKEQIFSDKYFNGKS